MTAPTASITAEQSEQLRQDLLRTLARIERSMKNVGNGAADLDQTSIGRLSRIEALQNRGFTENLKERERIQLQQVADALGRLDQGAYGVCTACRAPILFERLLVYPETLTCTGCGF